LQLCLAHPERCLALVLVVPLAYAPKRATGRAPSPFLERVLNTIASSDFLFWTATKVAHSTLLRTILGTPVEVYRSATVDERRSADQMLLTVLPVSRRIAGIVNDSIVASNLTRDPLENIRVPTLVISTADDLYGTYESALYTAEQVQDGTFVGFRTGGHLLLGHEEEARSEITSFLKARVPTETKTAVAG
jgi:pimeloyl-ACP methyl ester carboxylesterase